MDWRAVRAVFRPILQKTGQPSLRELKRLTGIDPSTLVRWAKDSERPINLNKLVVVIEALGVTPADFFAQIDALRSGASVPFNKDGKRDLRSESEVPQDHGPTAPLSASEFQRLADLFFKAAEASDRQTIRGLLADFAFAFEHAAEPGGQTPVARRTPAESAEGDRKIG